MIVPCAHIAAYYQRMWEARPCIAFNLLRHGYRQWAEGNPKRWLQWYSGGKLHRMEANNLYGNA